MSTPTVVAQQGNTAEPPSRRMRLRKTGGVLIGVLVIVFLALQISSQINERRVSTAPPELQGSADQSIAIPPAAGATKIKNGVPVGYAHNERGATAAATNYLATLYGDKRILTPDSTAIIATLAAPGQADDLTVRLTPAITAARAALAMNSDGQETPGDQIAYHMAPLSYSVDKITADAATVTVWWVGMVGIAATDTPFPVTAVWGTDTVTLTWADADWKLLDAQHKDGPAPVTGTDPGTVESIRKALQGTPYGYGS